MYGHTVKLVLPGFGPVSHVVEELVKVDLEGEFGMLIGLWVELESYK